MKIPFSFAILVASFSLAAVPASAEVVFDNYPINGTELGWTINSGYSVSDSFTLSAPEVLTGVNFGAWTDSGYAISSVDWAIGTEAFGNDVSSGSGAAVTSSDPISNDFGYVVSSASFSLPSISLGPGTYYLTLQDSVSGDGVGFWDLNDGEGPDGAGIVAYENSLGLLNGPSNSCGGNGSEADGNCAESFQLEGASATPEPGTAALIGGGLLLIAGVVRRKTVRQ